MGMRSRKMSWYPSFTWGVKLCGCLNVVFCVVLVGGEEIPAKKPATEGEFIKILECERIQFSKCKER